jgi:hypothetical protein
MAIGKIGVWTTVCDSLNDVVPNRSVNHEDVRQADPQEFGSPEAGYQVQFLN